MTLVKGDADCKRTGCRRNSVNGEKLKRVPGQDRILSSLQAHATGSPGPLEPVDATLKRMNPTRVERMTLRNQVTLESHALTTVPRVHWYVFALGQSWSTGGFSIALGTAKVLFDS